MSQLLIFTNPGEIDIRGATIAGLTAKVNTKTAIGKFGTGLKYAIASVLRMGGKVTIWAGTAEYIFFTRELDFRGEEHHQIIMDCRGVETPLGFTTHYGEHWEPWMIYRELYANALDEGGGVALLDIPPSPSSGQTHIVIDCPKLIEPHHARDQIILPPDRPIFHSNADCQLTITKAPSIYYRGVRVHDTQALFTWNVTRSLDLTEDRTIRGTYSHAWTCAKLLMTCTHEETIWKALAAGDDLYEASFEFHPHNGFSPQFLDVATRFYKKHPKLGARLRNFLMEHAPASCEPERIALTHIQQLQLDKAKKLAAMMSVEVADVDISVRDLGNSVLGRYDRPSDRVFLSPEVFSQGTKQVLSTLYEELVHRETSKPDLTYDMQTYLFNRIVDIYEEHVFGEPV